MIVTDSYMIVIYYYFLCERQLTSFLTLHTFFQLCFSEDYLNFYSELSFQKDCVPLKQTKNTFISNFAKLIYHGISPCYFMTSIYEISWNYLQQFLSYSSRKIFVIHRQTSYRWLSFQTDKQTNFSKISQKDILNFSKHINLSKFESRSFTRIQHNFISKIEIKNKCTSKVIYFRNLSPVTKKIIIKQTNALNNVHYWEKCIL